MQITERPSKLEDLDLMKRLEAYGLGNASWRPDQFLGQLEKTECRKLHSNLIALVQDCLHPLMDRVTAREMQSFTMHDHNHGLKVAHLMWGIIKPDRRQVLTPPEIALLVISAHLHDLGMGLSQSEREVRLGGDSDIWIKFDNGSKYKHALSQLSSLSERENAPNIIAAAALQVQQAQEALLCMDTRERHATKERYIELLHSLEVIHARDPSRIVDIENALSFSGDSLREKLIEICVSHNEDAHVLLDRSPVNTDQFRFPKEYPVGNCLVDVRFVAATLRLADILDFDRERTPPILFHYLLPSSGDPSENISVAEWSKHLAISNWEIADQKLIFRGRSNSAFTHHMIIEFCSVIEEEIARTRSLFSPDEWAFNLETKVEALIEAEGYRYIPYRFSLDEERIYQLLMGKEIYPDRLDALRELIQNSIDACKMRDALMLCYDESVVPATHQRIIVEFESPINAGGRATLRVKDTGIGMDRYVIENFLLKVGRSYYRSNEFFRTRALLLNKALDFQPVSEFGIGFMSVFMLADKVTVETASAFPLRQDTQRRLLKIDGIGKLIEVQERSNEALPRFQGTQVSLMLRASESEGDAPTFEDIETYLKEVCLDVAFPIHLRLKRNNVISETIISSQGLKVPVPAHLVEAALCIPVNDEEAGLRGEIVIYRAKVGTKAQAKFSEENPVEVEQASFLNRRRHVGRSGFLLRGGFTIGRVPGLPEYVLSPSADARIAVTSDKHHPNQLPKTDIARTRIAEHAQISSAIFRAWFEPLLKNLEDIQAHPIGNPDIEKSNLRKAKWLQEYSAFDVYRLARASWQSWYGDMDIGKWEKGEIEKLPIALGYDRRMHWLILEMVLPKICELEVQGLGKLFVRAPKVNWVQELEGWKTYIDEGLDWGFFAAYEGGRSQLLCDVYGPNSYLNVLHKNRFVDFTSVELRNLMPLFDKLVTARKYKNSATLNDESVRLLKKLLDVASDLTISSVHYSCVLKEFISISRN